LTESRSVSETRGRVGAVHVTPSGALTRRARRRLNALRRREKDPRFLRVIGRFVREGLLLVNHDVPVTMDAVSVPDVLWAGEVEPRLLELLPALIVKRPSLFTDVRALPDDLADVVTSLKRDREPAAFRGIPGAAVQRWLRRVGRKGKVPSRLKSFRFTADDQRLLAHLVEKLAVSESEVIRRGLRALV
jgi:hypothetical protein